jgi:Ca2+-binding EF-hand superfamily protein
MNEHGFNSKFISDDLINFLKTRFEALKCPLNKAISIQDLRVIIKELGYLPTHKEIDDICSETNHKVDFIYLLVICGRVLSKMKKFNFKKELEEAFDLLDRDKNGTIELEELLSCGVKGVDTTELRQIFDTMDLNHDGHITREEYTTFINQ